MGKGLAAIALAGIIGTTGATAAGAATITNGNYMHVHGVELYNMGPESSGLRTLGAGYSCQDGQVMGTLAVAFVDGGQHTLDFGPFGPTGPDGAVHQASGEGSVMMTIPLHPASASDIETHGITGQVGLLALQSSSMDAPLVSVLSTTKTCAELPAQPFPDGHPDSSSLPALFVVLPGVAGFDGEPVPTPELSAEAWTEITAQRALLGLPDLGLPGQGEEGGATPTPTPTQPAPTQPTQTTTTPSQPAPTGSTAPTAQPTGPRIQTGTAAPTSGGYLDEVLLAGAAATVLAGAAGALALGRRR